MCNNVTRWLGEREEAQTPLAPTETPAFLSNEVAAKLEPLELEASVPLLKTYRNDTLEPTFPPALWCPSHLKVLRRLFLKD